MRALVYTGTQQSEMRVEPLPSPGEGEVVVKVDHCGICGSDMHAWHGHDERRIPPLVLGHEAVGIAQSGRYEGQRVAINPLMTCGECDACLGGAEHLCPKRELIGMRVPGAFSEQVAIKERNLTPLPDHLSFVDAALAEPLACAVHTARLGIEKGNHAPEDLCAVVLGGGAIGLLSALVLQDQGVRELWVAETNAHRHPMLKSVVDGKIYNPLDGSSRLPEKPDLVIDAVGSGATRKAASNMVRPGGVIAHIGLQDNGEGLDTRRLTLQEITFVGTYCYTKEDFQTALDLLAQAKISASGWSEVRPLEDGARSFEDIHNGKAPPKIILSVT